ncbi:unnamed protein product [Clonostachys solani]|uniref:Uncharacterized protein n=1 Tax=Clonostachys solani TaxID=160281 RepID=A0A9N9Z6W1_9HYPO|nr:unnamed protein product [Clonostachys solani]
MKQYTRAVELTLAACFGRLFTASKLGQLCHRRWSPQQQWIVEDRAAGRRNCSDQDRKMDEFGDQSGKLSLS